MSHWWWHNKLYKSNESIYNTIKQIWKDNLKLYILKVSHTFDFVSVEQFIHEITKKYFNNQTYYSDRSIILFKILLWSKSMYKN